MVTKSTIESDIWKLIYDRVKAQVTTVTNSDASTSTIKYYSSAFPEQRLDAETDYPIIVVDPLDLKWKDFTLTRKTVEGTFTIDVYATKSESADRFRQAIVEAIETYRPTLKANGITFINLDGTAADDVQRGSFTIHMRTCTFSFKWRFTKS